MSWLSTALPLAAGETRPAGAAPLDQVVLATGVVVVLSALLGWALVGHRTGRNRFFARLVAWFERLPAFRGVAGWSTLPLMLAMVSLITALLGMYWDIALHIGVGRDEGPLANPAHYPILLGLFGLSASGAIACALPTAEQAGPAALRVSRRWRMPVGGVLLTGAGAYALLGFPLDDVWHRLFGQDVTLWGPTHLMLIGGAGLSLVAMAVLLEEGTDRAAVPDGSLRRRRYLMRVGVTGGMLIGLSVFQAEWDFGVPQFRLVLHPLLIAVAAGLTLVTARLWLGRGGALAAVGFYVLVRGGVSVVVGPWVIGELWSAIPLYVVEALCVEAAALVVARRPLRLGVVSGLLIGTVGFAGELAWTQLVFPLPWTSDIILEGVLLAVVGGVAGGVLGALLVMGLEGTLPRRTLVRVLFAAAVLAIAAGVVDGLRTTRPDDLTASLDLSAASRGEAATTDATVRFDRPPVTGEEPAWLTITAWQGGGSEGLHVAPLREVSPTVWETTEPMPVGGTWKTMVRLQDGRDISALPVFLPSDEALGEDVVAARDATRSFTDEKSILQRELDDDIPAWLWTVAGLVVLLCSAVLVLALGWGVSRYHRLASSRHRDATRARTAA
ncbi:hypothetical protein ASG49_14020 [Marmoricola sp. Leaf446]|nr:hypothetical protein ASG49_14020 [Marmoricola sp. Leaf446]